MEILNLISALSLLLACAYFFTVLNFIRGWSKIRYYNVKDQVFKTKVSIIIAARNEEANIAQTLDAILVQTYPADHFEIIVVNDHSTDRTADIVSAYAAKNVKLINFAADKALNSYKKAAIQLAIADAFGELIVTTDADCVMGKDWLATVVSFYEANNYKMISSPVAYHQEQNLFERLQSLEFLYLIGLGGSTIGNKSPSTCNGANLAYQKQAFFDVGGFKGIDDLASGDDELLLQKIAAKFDDQIGFLKNREAIIYTHAKPTIGAFIDQRKRWASKSTRYQNKLIVVIGITIWLFNLSIFVNLIWGLFNTDYLFIAGIQFLLKVLIEYLFLENITAFAKRTKLLILLPLLNILHIVYMIYIGVAGNSGTYSWKGRTVK